MTPDRKNLTAVLAMAALLCEGAAPTWIAAVGSVSLVAVAAAPQEAQAFQKRRPAAKRAPAERPQANRPNPGRPGGSRPSVRGGSHTNIDHNNVNVNVNNGGGRYDDDRHHGHYDRWDDDWDDHWHPVRTAATVAVTAAVVGSIVRSIPPGCSTVYVNGISYSQCGSTWYQPQYSGSSVQYVVVNPPR